MAGKLFLGNEEITPVLIEGGEGVEEKAYLALSKIKDYLYNTTYANIDYNFAKNYFLTKKPEINPAACSTARNGYIVGRNYDWLYNEGVGFVVRTPRTAGRYATLGVANGVPRLTKELMDAEIYDSESFKLLPFYTVDAVNEYGVTASILVVPKDKGQTIGTTPEVETKDEICTLMLVRYIVDNFQTAQEAVEYLRDYVSVYSPQGLADMGYEVHFMVSDAEKSYSIEFVQNAMVVKDITSHPYMTNFYLEGVTFNEDGTVYTPADVPTHLPTSQGITNNGSGLERYNLIVADYETANSVTGMRSLMDKLKYTKAYLAGTNPQWNTEFVGTWEDFGTFTVDTPADDYADLKTYIRSVYESRERDGKTWQTVNSSVYDLENKTLNLIVQEDGEELEFSFDYYTRPETAELVANEMSARQLAENELSARIDGKQDEIDDLETIRSNAQAGKSASDTVAGYGNIVTHNASEFATASQGAKADSAVQPGVMNSAISAHNTSNLSHEDIRAVADEALTRASDRSVSKVFETTSAMETWLKDVTHKGELHVGDNIYIIDTTVPDYWVSAVYEEPDETTGYYYRINQLTPEQPDITNMVTTNTAQTITGNKNFTGQILKDGANIVTASYDATTENATFS